MATVSKKPEENVIRNWIYAVTHKRIRTLRLISQITFLFVLNGIILGLSRIPFPAPISLPAGSPFGIVWGGFDAVQYVLAEGHFPFLVIGIFFFTGATVGKFFCGWACPVGFWQDIVAAFPVKRWKPSKPLNRDLQEFSGALLWLAVIFTGFVGYQRISGGNIADNIWTRIPYGVVDPAGTLFVTLFYGFHWDVLPGDNFSDALDAMGSLFLWKMLVLFVITYISMKVPRAYCRWVCPTGALLGYASKNSILTIKRDPLKCKDDCKDCEDACPTGVPISEEDPDGISNTLCINCGNCIDACADAMSFGFRL
ncbi:MAG: 4Fe-4S binding protein [Candidatus Kariarchaeaceae archaeon]|jgi:polyferredoxin